jgi:hypothetical protein
MLLTGESDNNRGRPGGGLRVTQAEPAVSQAAGRFRRRRLGAGESRSDSESESPAESRGSAWQAQAERSPLAGG